MLDQSLLQSHFIGRDGFRWWIGQIPEIKHWIEQVSGDGWGQRYKVRIIGYHPLDEQSLPNEDLPWAQVMFPVTAGTGAANVSTGTQLQQGDVVIGFFLDGDNAQIPLIIGALGRTKLYSEDNYTFPFQSFTGYSSLMKKNPGLTPSQTSEPTQDSQRSPESITPGQAEKRTAETGQRIIPENTAIGDKIPLANTVKNTKIDKIKSYVQNLIKKVRSLQGDINRIKEAINKAIDYIVTLSNDFIGGLYNFLIYGNEKKGGSFPGLIGLLQTGLKLLYQTIYAQVLAATGNPVAAHAAGVAAQKAMVLPVKALEEAFGCIVGEVLEKLRGMVSDILYSTLDNVNRFVSCAADQFAGSLLSSIVGILESALNGPLNGVSQILKFFSDFNLANLLKEGIGLLSEVGVSFACNQNISNFKDLVNEWTVGGGPSGSKSTLLNSMADTYNSVKEITNIISSGVDIKSVKECFTNALQFASPPTINIFGGGGSGAKAIPIFGNIVTKSDGNVTASIIGVQLTDPGSGYKFSPFIEIIDDNEQGYGAVARSIINPDSGKIESIYIVSEGENYSVGNTAEYSVLKVVVENGGNGYDVNSTKIIDDLGNTYDFEIDGGRIRQVIPLNNYVNSLPILDVISANGSGAILYPILGAFEKSGVIPSSPDSESSNLFTGKVQTSIDCPI